MPTTAQQINTLFYCQVTCPAINFLPEPTPSVLPVSILQPKKDHHSSTNEVNVIPLLVLILGPNNVVDTHGPSNDLRRRDWPSSTSAVLKLIPNIVIATQPAEQKSSSPSPCELTALWQRHAKVTPIGGWPQTHTLPGRTFTAACGWGVLIRCWQCCTNLQSIKLTTRQ